MTTDYRVALEGFSTFERETLVSFFRLAEARTPSYGVAMSILDAHFIVADADDPDSVAAVIASERVAETVFVGAQSPGDAMARLSRPVDPLQIVRELDALAALQSRAPTLDDEVATTPMPLSETAGAADAAAITAAADTAANTAAADTAPAAEPAAASPSAAPALHSVAPLAPAAALRPVGPPIGVEAAGKPKAPMPPIRAITPAEVLVVEDSDVAQRYLAHVLGRLGLTAVRASNAQQALELLAEHDYPLVLIDVMLGDDSEFDGLVLCQQIKAPSHLRRGGVRKRDGALTGPRVVFVTALGNQSDRVRGSLAGGDGYLTKPLDEALFARTLADLMPSLFVSPSSRTRPPKPQR